MKQKRKNQPPIARLRVSYYNQAAMKRYVDTAFRPLFELQPNEAFTLRFENKAFVCTYMRNKTEFAYKDIEKAETSADGLVLYLKNNCYITVAVEQSEKHNTALYDAVLLLKKRCRFRVKINTPIDYPECDADGRFQTDQSPIIQCSFSLSDTEIKRMLWYDDLFDEHLIVFVVIAAALLLMSVLTLNIWLFLVFAVVIIACICFARFFCDHTQYVQNHQGILTIILYEDVMVVRLRFTDLELDYTEMKESRSVLGLWRLKCGRFFTLILPKRIIKDNPDIYLELCKKINEKSR